VASRVLGLEDVKKNLNREIAAIKGRTYAGLLAAGLFVEGEAKALAPVDTGALKNSGYTRKAPGPLAVEVGFSAAYAIFVHENLEARHHVGQAKFLQTPLDTKRAQILAIIQERARVGGKE
jgi:hypothetical protein